MAERRGQSAERLCPCARACVWRAFREQAASKQCGESRRVAASRGESQTPLKPYTHTLATP